MMGTGLDPLGQVKRGTTRNLVVLQNVIYLAVVPLSFSTTVA